MFSLYQDGFASPIIAYPHSGVAHILNTQYVACPLFAFHFDPWLLWAFLTDSGIDSLSATC